MFQKIQLFLFKHKQIVILIAFVLFCSLFWRFVNYGERWTLSQDQARDGIIGLYMVENHILPLVGPPSSAGSFSFGPFYYWLIALFTLIIPTINGPWIGFTFFSVITPLLFFWIGFHFGGKVSGFIFGMIAAFCSEFIFHSPDMLNPIPIAFLVTLALLFVIKIVDQKKIILSFLLGIVIGLAINFHLQALGLLIVIPLISIFNNFESAQKFKILGISLLGLFTSFLPLIIFNYWHHNILFSNLFSFLFRGQTTFVTENNLIKDLLIFWPQLWGTTIVHLPLLGYGFVFLLMFAGVFALGNKKTLTKSFYVIAITFLFQIFFLFVYQGVRSPIYLIVFHSFLVFFICWTLVNFYQFNKIAGLAVFIILLLISIPQNLKIIQDNKTQVSDILEIKKVIDEKNTAPIKIQSAADSNMITLPLFYLYQKEQRISDSGYEAFVCENRIIKDAGGITEKWSCPMDAVPYLVANNYRIYEKSSLNSEQQKYFTEVRSEVIYSWLVSNYKKLQER